MAAHNKMEVGTMKYCSKCGNELFDEAVICPKCGCPVESGTANQNTDGKGRGVQKRGLGKFLIAFFGILAVISGINVAVRLVYGESVISSFLYFICFIPGLYAGIIILSPKKQANQLTVWGLIIASIVIFYIAGGIENQNHADIENNINNYEQEEIELTVDNIESYLSLDFEYSKIEETQIITATAYSTDVILNTYSTMGGSFNNVQITVTVLLENAWEVNPNDDAAETSGDGYLSFTFKLPANGDYTESHSIRSLLGVILKDDISYRITDVNGTFTKH